MVSRLMGAYIFYCLCVSFLFAWLVLYLVRSCLSYCTDYVVAQSAVPQAVYYYPSS